MPSYPITSDDLRLCRQVALWLDIRKKWAPQANTPPSDVDILKSALFARLRAGLEPLEYPPPLGLSYPWYSLVESRTPSLVGMPHHAGYNIFFQTPGSDWPLSVTAMPDPADTGHDKEHAPRDGRETAVVIHQHGYTIVERKSATDYILRDASHDTPYRFRLHWDAAHVRKEPPAPELATGAWLMRNMEFETAEAAAAA